MEWENWKPFYLDIVSRLGLNPDEDSKATTILDSLLMNVRKDFLLDRLREIIENQTIVICGAGPSLDKHLEEINTSDFIKEAVFIAADGAASALKDFGYECQIIVTDLDGNLEDIMELVKNGAIPIVHAHGDNIEKLEEFVPRFDRLLGSTQVKPTEHVLLWGGFSDGDRACYIVSHYNPKRIFLVGMDFGTIVGRWSKPDHSENFLASKRKTIKLEIAKELIFHLRQSSNIEYIFFR